MIVTLTRHEHRPDRTFGRLGLTYEGDTEPRPFCDTLEDVDRGLEAAMPLAEIRAAKVPGRTAIPTGEYTLRVARSPKRGRDVVWVDGVPGFRAIQIHAGDGPEDSDGCPLLGRLNGDQLDGGPALEAWLVEVLAEAQKRGERRLLRVVRGL